jgi:uncharacterized membrane protein HdeD (DUF308 family)
MQRNWFILVPGILLVVFGLLCVFYPGLTLLSVTFIIGAGFLFAGIINLISFVQGRLAFQRGI